MTEITPDFIRGVLAGRDYERETATQYNSAIKDVLNVLEHKIVMIDDIHKHMSKNGQILLDYNKKIILTLMKDISDLL